MKKLFYIVIVVITINSGAYAQTNIAYKHFGIEQAKKTAKRAGKKIFIDSYASWCTPCKVMDKDMNTNKNLVNFFNKNFINVKVDMNGRESEIMQSNYGVVFLPTLMILSEDGNTLYRIDKKISAEELLANAQRVVNGDYVERGPPVTEVHQVPQKTAIVKSVELPAKNAEVEILEDNHDAAHPNLSVGNVDTVADIKTGEEKILYVLGSADMAIPPEYLYEEAYFKLEMKDDSYREACIKYLSSQADWSSNKNVKFIFDFVSDTRSSEFKYMMENKVLFDSIVGKENIDRTIDILVNQRISRGYPRPALDEALELYRFIDKEGFQEKAYQYYLQSLKEKECYDDYIEVGQHYLAEINKSDDLVMYNIAYVQAEFGEGKSDYKKGIKLLKKAIELTPNSAVYYDTLAYLYFKLNKKKKAIKAIRRAIELQEGNGLSTDSAIELLKMIEEL